MDAFRRPELCLSAEMGRAVASSSQCTDRIDRGEPEGRRGLNPSCVLSEALYISFTGLKRLVLFSLLRGLTSCGRRQPSANYFIFPGPCAWRSALPRP